MNGTYHFSNLFSFSKIECLQTNIASLQKPLLIRYLELKKPHKLLIYKALQCILSAHEWNRTITPLRMADFESAASTNSATWACSR